MNICEKKVKVYVYFFKGLASYCKAETTFTFYFTILPLSRAFLSINNREMKSESGFSFAMASQPFHLVGPYQQLAGAAPVHYVHFVKYDDAVSFYDAVSDTIRRRGGNRGIFTEEGVDTVAYFGGNHGSRV